MRYYSNSRYKKALLIISFLVLLGGVSFLIWQNLPGSSKCRVSKCVDNIVETPNHSADGISFDAPALSTKYISAVSWPPKVTVSETSFLCTESQEADMRSIEKRMVDNHSYCVVKRVGGAAGSTYTDYTYITEKDSKTIEISFSLRAVQCANYDEPTKAECEAEREAFDLDSLVHRMVNSVVF
jgi:hypothetical protein